MNEPSPSHDSSSETSRGETSDAGNPRPADPIDPADPADPARPEATGWRRQLLATHPWMVYVVPFAVFIGLTSLEPLPNETSKHSSQDSPVADSPEFDAPYIHEYLPAPTPPATAEGMTGGETAAESEGWIPYRFYPLVYLGKILATLLAMVFVWPGYQAHPWKLNFISLLVGVVGVFLWVGISHLGMESRLWNLLGWESIAESGGRSQYNPFRELADWPLLAVGFLAIRFLGLVAMVPIIEEFFLRGFVMRFVMADRWWEIPFGQVTAKAVLLGTLLPMLLHPGELLAAAVWFSMVTWLMVRTRNIWDCVAAHAVTNLLLGIYAVTFNQWQFL